VHRTQKRASHAGRVGLADDTLADLLSLLRDQQAQNSRLIESMMEAHVAQTEVFKSWLDMFKPQASPLNSTSPDDRARLREAAEAAEWEPMEASLRLDTKDPLNG